MSQPAQWEFSGDIPENYARYMEPTIFASWAAALVDLAALQPGDRVLDVACGTGVVTRCAAQRVGAAGQVVGLDVTAAMLAVARTLLPAADASVEWREASAEVMPFADAAFDVVLCQQGLQFFPDKPAALREMHRVLVADGRLVLGVWRPITCSPGFAVLADALAHHVSLDAGALLHTGPFSLGQADVLSTLIDSAGFRDITLQSAMQMVRFSSPEEFVQRYAASSSLGGLVAQVDDHARVALLDEVSTALQPYISAEGLAFPIEAHLVRAKK
jgi:ubiquinone/menaquinone biosynthesis C-methylase UbiE